jgi:hypothetical protein
MANVHGKSTVSSMQPKMAQRSMPQKSQPRRKNQNSMSLSQLPFNDATSRIRRVEWFASVKMDASKTSFGYTQSISLKDSTMPVLTKLSALFDKFIVHSISIHYKGSSATTRDGVVYVAFDYNGDNKTPGVLNDVVGKPYVSCPVWQSDVKLPLKFDSTTRYVKGTDPRDKLGTCLIFATSVASKTEVVLGEIFVEYDITLIGLDA